MMKKIIIFLFVSCQVPLLVAVRDQITDVIKKSSVAVTCRDCWKEQLAVFDSQDNQLMSITKTNWYSGPLYQMRAKEKYDISPVKIEAYFNLAMRLARLQNHSPKTNPAIINLLKKDTVVVRSKKVGNMEKYVAFDCNGRKMIVGMCTVLKNKEKDYWVRPYLNTYNANKFNSDYTYNQKAYLEFLKELASKKPHVPF